MDNIYKPKNTNVLEWFSDYLKRIETTHAQANLEGKEIIVSTDFNVEQLSESGNIKKTPIVWPLHLYNMFYITEVPPNTSIPIHFHDEPVFRYVVKGDLEINGIKIQPETWFVVQKGVKYQIKTESGYTALVGYTSICQTNQQP